ncbi:hypothetical protein CALVIDRAFT_527567 [Calocera viscosa TUFC12733]|uniref:Uncharacterized protein n=1 Tax=Calocera viscosa (strain TUFC12733) TaxID=1330018 RepID=A0A167LW90_CALVF|nr:hypothetical protein CALVIDRAFT_527567 [Calocera viscosa TUFC12733]
MWILSTVIKQNGNLRRIMECLEWLSRSGGTKQYTWNEKPQRMVTEQISNWGKVDAGTRKGLIPLVKCITNNSLHFDSVNGELINYLWIQPTIAMEPLPQDLVPADVDAEVQKQVALKAVVTLIARPVKVGSDKMAFQNGFDFIMWAARTNPALERACERVRNIHQTAPDNNIGSLYNDEPGLLQRLTAKLGTPSDPRVFLSDISVYEEFDASGWLNMMEERGVTTLFHGTHENDDIPLLKTLLNHATGKPLGPANTPAERVRAGLQRLQDKLTELERGD